MTGHHDFHALLPASVRSEAVAAGIRAIQHTYDRIEEVDLKALQTDVPIVLSAVTPIVRRKDLGRIAYLEAALRKIARGEGRFNRDPAIHCANTVEDLTDVASRALAGTWKASEGL